MMTEFIFVKGIFVKSVIINMLQSLKIWPILRKKDMFLAYLMKEI